MCWIVGPVYDSLLLIFVPLLALALGWLLSSPSLQAPVTLFDTTGTLPFLLYMTLTQGHLLVTLVRTHGNAVLFRRHPWRFTLVPLLVYAAMFASDWVRTTAFVLATYWDVYHSALQTFGLARIYDARAGVSPEEGRTADLALNLAILLGPILGGVMLGEHLAALQGFGELRPAAIAGVLVDPGALARLPEAVMARRDALRLALGAATGAILAFYALHAVRRARAGRKIPWQKSALLASTAVASTAAWGFNSFGNAFLIGNISHAVQYFALVWTTEKENLAERTGAGQGAGGRAILLAAFLAVPNALGLLLFAFTARPVASLLTLCALMHFWYDGFIWSVRKGEHLRVGAA